MDPILAAIEAIDSRDPREDFSHNQIAKEFSIVQSTLIRLHKGIIQSRELAHKKLHLH